MYGFGLNTHKRSMVDEKEAQNILTSYISEDILGLLIMDRVQSYIKQ